MESGKGEIWNEDLEEVGVKTIYRGIVYTSLSRDSLLQFVRQKPAYSVTIFRSCNRVQMSEFNALIELSIL